MKSLLTLLIIFLMCPGFSQTQDSTLHFKSKNRIWQFTFGVNYPLGSFNSIDNFNHGHASNGPNLQFGYLGALKNQDVSLAAGVSASFNIFTIDAQSKINHLEEAISSTQGIYLIGQRPFISGVIYGRIGLVARSGKQKHGLNTFSVDLGPYAIRPGGFSYNLYNDFTFTGTESGHVYTESSIGLMYGFTSEYLIYVFENFGFYLGAEFKSSIGPVKNTGHRLVYWIPRIGLCF